MSEQWISDWLAQERCRENEKRLTGKAAEEGAEGERVVGDTAARDLGKDSGRLALDSERKEKTKRKMQALMMPGRTLMPAMMMATTKGEALALAAELLASLRSFEFQGTSQPMTMMPPM
jgi:hypothetical protein